eukprot:351627-Chlamydomonas_euryale.AAC.1
MPQLLPGTSWTDGRGTQGGRVGRLDQAGAAKHEKAEGGWATTAVSGWRWEGVQVEPFRGWCLGWRWESVQ